MSTLSPAPSNSSTTPTTSATTPTTSKIAATLTPTSSTTPNIKLNSPVKLALSAFQGGEPPRSQRGLNKPKCSVCGNVARSRCPYLSCKSCCAKAENPCPIHVLPKPPLRTTRPKVLSSFRIESSVAAKNDNVVTSQAKDTSVAAKNDKVVTPQEKGLSSESKRKNGSSEKCSDEKRSKVSNVATSLKIMTVTPRDLLSGRCLSLTSSGIESSTIARSRLSSCAASTDKSLFDKEMKALDDDVDSGLYLANCALRAKRSLLEQTMKDHQQEVKKLSTRIYELEAIDKSDKKSIKELRDQLGQVNDMFRKTKQELDQLKDESSKNIKSLEEKVSNFEDNISNLDYTNDVCNFYITALHSLCDEAFKDQPTLLTKYIEFRATHKFDTTPISEGQTWESLQKSGQGAEESEG